VIGIANLTAHSPVVLVFGISGATWRVMRPLMEAGRLPNISRLAARGCSGVLSSHLAEGDEHYRPQVAWASLATGHNPDRHGITRYYHTGEDLQVPALWERFANAGAPVGVYGWPLDWPPPSLGGFIIPSHWARDTQTWPPELSVIKEIDRDQQDGERDGERRPDLLKRLNLIIRLLRLRPRPATLASIAFALASGLTGPSHSRTEWRALRLRHAKLDLSSDLFRSLCRRHQPRFRAFVTFLVDLASHRYWRYHEPDAFSETETELADRCFATAVVDAYERVDRALGRILSDLPSNAVVAVLSEHGMGAEPNSAEVGRWRYVIRGKALLRMMGRADVLARPVARWIAIRPLAGQALPNDLAERLREVTVVETSLPLFQVIENSNREIVIKLNLDRSVALYNSGNLQNLSVRIGSLDAVPFESICRRLGRTRSAMHERDGILIIGGEGIRQLGMIEPSRLIDVAPTLLKAAGLPFADCAGKPLDVFG
jgi:predicted AlkP superfamily phosphohydrolase/phosphomutase